MTHKNQTLTLLKTFFFQKNYLLGSRLMLSCLRQALPSFQIPVSPHIYTSISWAAAPSTASSLSPVSVPVVPEPASTSGS